MSKCLKGILRINIVYSGFSRAEYIDDQFSIHETKQPPLAVVLYVLSRRAQLVQSLFNLVCSLYRCSQFDNEVFIW